MSITSDHVSKRLHLPKQIKEHLIPMPRESWHSHSGFNGKASFFIQYHQNIVDTILQIKSKITDCLDHNIQQNILSIVIQTKQLLSSLDHHHKIEDQMYFPVFKQQNSKIISAIELLEKDHLSVAFQIERLSGLLIKLERNRQTNTNHFPFDLMVQFFELVTDFEKMVRRHLYDEEEIIIPIFILDKRF